VDADELRRLADQQLADLDARTPNRLFSHPQELTICEAYALQQEISRLRERRGERLIGYKIGCTSPPIQRQLGLREPIFGRIFEAGCFESGARISRDNYVNLAIEGELAMRLAGDVPDSQWTDPEYLEAIESVFPVIELHDYVLCSPEPCCQELIASNGMHAGFVLAENLPAKPPVEVQRMSLQVHDEEIDRTPEPWTMGGPIASLRWLASQVGPLGLRLLRGQVILTGSPMKLHRVSAGGRIVVEAPPLGRSCAEIV